MFAIVSRQVLIESRFSAVVCAPIYSSHEGLSTQVSVGIGEGLKHASSVHCDELVSLPKTRAAGGARRRGLSVVWRSLMG